MLPILLAVVKIASLIELGMEAFQAVDKIIVDDDGLDREEIEKKLSEPIENIKREIKNYELRD
jgi:hypothetical protein